MGEKFRPRPDVGGPRSEITGTPVNLDDPRVQGEIRNEVREYQEKQRRAQRTAKRRPALRSSADAQTEEKPAYTLADLEEAQEDLKVWKRRLKTDTSNNPNKFKAGTRTARRRLEIIEAALKEAGVIELTEEETRDRELDELYPNAKSRTIVTYKGKRYQIRYVPREKSRSGKTVHEWGHHWHLLEK
ncbi:hypothetical protein HY477_00595 [Candidatus Uhrbacteria bacterium]|nr:hypothetical protein [Candidatus Uhrbacteria bacterium]